MNLGKQKSLFPKQRHLNLSSTRSLISVVAQSHMTIQTVTTEGDVPVFATLFSRPLLYYIHHFLVTFNSQFPFFAKKKSSFQIPQPEAPTFLYLITLCTSILL